MKKTTNLESSKGQSMHYPAILESVNKGFTFMVACNMNYTPASGDLPAMAQVQAHLLIEAGITDPDLVTAAAKKCGSNYEDWPNAALFIATAQAGRKTAPMLEHDQSTAEQASRQDFDRILVDMPEVRERAKDKVEAAKILYGQGWQAKYMRDLVTEAKHRAILDKQSGRKVVSQRRASIEKFRADAGLPPQGETIYDSWENYVEAMKKAGHNIKGQPI